MNNLFALLLTLVLGLFLLVGSYLVFKYEKNEKLVHFSISIAFGVMITLMFLELLPEAYELITKYKPKPFNYFALVGFSCLGIVLLKILDHFVPDHEEDHRKKNGEADNLLHIGLVSSIALMLHNVIEGMAIYSTATSSVKLGLLVSIGVGLHNIPLGMVITSTFYKHNKDKKKTAFYVTGISLSTFIGGLLMFFMKRMINDYKLGVLLCITIGMVFYIVLFELLPHLIHEKDRKTTMIGVGSGILILLISQLF